MGARRRGARQQVSSVFSTGFVIIEEFSGFVLLSDRSEVCSGLG